MNRPSNKGRMLLRPFTSKPLKKGTDEKLLAEKLGMVMQEASKPKRVKTQNKRKWFVEYCCSENSACCRVAEACSIPYLGLSRDFGDLTDPQVFDQVLYWFND